MKTREFSTLICLLVLVTGTRSYQLDITDSLLETRLYSLNRTRQVGALDQPWDPILELLFSFLTPHGDNVSYDCNNASHAYIDALNNVSPRREWRGLTLLCFTSTDSHLHRVWTRLEMVY